MTKPRIAIFDQTLSRLVTPLDSIEFMTFPGGEPHVKLTDTAIEALRAETAVTIDCRPQSFLDLGYLMLLTNVLRLTAPYTLLSLLMPYVPGARQDRGEPFTAAVIAGLINNLSFGTVQIYDPHSPVIVSFLGKVGVKDTPLPRRLNEYVAVIAPDQGATHRAIGMAERVGLTRQDVVYCSKKRDSVTGALSGFELDTRNLPQGRYLLFDDICDGGGTFLGVYDAIALRYAELYGVPPTIDLFVTHGIFSKGTDQLLSKFSEIYSTTSWRSYQDLMTLNVTPIRIHPQEILSS